TTPGDDDLRTLSREQPCGGGPDTRPATGDQRNLVLEPHLDRLLLFPNRVRSIRSELRCSVRRSRPEERTVADPLRGWRGQQEGDRIESRCVLRSLLGEARERLVSRANGEPVLLHVAKDVFELVAADPGLVLL